MRKALLIVVLSLSFLQGCACFAKKDATITEKTVKLDPRVLESCKALIPLPTTFTIDPFGDILENVQANADAYADCAAKQETSIKLLKQFSNTKETK